jgi:glycosyltransferase involved in cell wall biosynthesis
MKNGNGNVTHGSLRVLLLGDGLALTTGFAQVIRHTAAAFVRAGWDVAQIASLDPPPDCDSRPYHAAGVRPFFPGESEPTGLGVLRHAVEQFAPDVLLCIADPGQAHNWQAQYEAAGLSLPFVLYAPVEGAPICPPYAAAFRFATTHGAAATVTEWAAQTLRDECSVDVPAISHGVDLRVFHPLPAYERQRLRRALGWSDRFVIAYVARNAARKSQDRLIKALAQLREVESDMRDVLLYLHCAPFDRYQLQGWDLAGLAHWCGVTDAVQFSDQTDAMHGEEQIGLAKKLACADLYVHPAQVEGFGLPILEAMACGLPVCVPADEGNMQEVASAAGLLMEVEDWATWFNGAQLANVSPARIAQTIKIVRNGGNLRQLRLRSIDRAGDQRFRWETMTDALTELVARAVTAQAWEKAGHDTVAAAMHPDEPEPINQHRGRAHATAATSAD